MQNFQINCIFYSEKSVHTVHMGEIRADNTNRAKLHYCLLSFLALPPQHTSIWKPFGLENYR